VAGIALVSFPSRGDGKPVAARLFLPPGYRPEDRSQKPRPAVFFIHGSGYATSVLKQWGAYAGAALCLQLLAGE
jgi:acetyl esterase/lipase